MHVVNQLRKERDDARRELEERKRVDRVAWDFAQAWAAQLDDEQLRRAAQLEIPGHAGMAAEQELARRLAAA